MIKAKDESYCEIWFPYKTTGIIDLQGNVKIVAEKWSEIREQLYFERMNGLYREKFKFTDLKEHLTDKELTLVKTLK
jgi:hypothetical protein